MTLRSPDRPSPAAARVVRLVAAATVAYSVAITVRPRLLAEPCGLTTKTGSVPDEIAALTRSIGTRDAALAAALAVVPTGAPMHILTAARVVCDASDAVWLGRVVPSGQRWKVVGAALGWAGIEVVTGVLAASKD